MAQDLTSGADIAAIMGGSEALGYPVVTDWGGPTSSFENQPGSVAAVSFAVRVNTPIAIVLDEFGSEAGHARVQGDDLQQLLQNGTRPPR
jgi:hypothetical protein